MSWFRVDDSFTDHPKVRSIPRADRKAAVGLWTLAGSYAARQLTDGFIFTDDVIDLGCATKDANALVKSGLWHAHGHDCGRCAPVPEGQYLFHDWLVYQRSREKVLAERAAATERQRIARERAKSQRDTGVTADATEGVVTVPPTRPDPTPSVNESGGNRNETLPASAVTDPPRKSRCTRHRNGNPTDENCGACRADREFDERTAAKRSREEAEARANCPDCGGTGWLEHPNTGLPAGRCIRHRRTA